MDSDSRPANEPTEPSGLTGAPDEMGGSSAASPSAASPSAPEDADADETRSCFICLQTAAETPGAAWVTPCPCTLEAHEGCMLRWIAETEDSRAEGTEGRRGRRGIRCPACNSRIRTEEPWDAVVALGDRWTQVYRRASPFVLLSTMLSMALAGSSFYGFQSLVQVAGEGATYDWFFWAGTARLRRAGGGRIPPTQLDRWREAAVLFRKVLLLNLVAPGLLLHRALPSVTNLLALPVSTVYGIHLLAHKKLPSTRPPSPAWVLVLAPLANAAYQSTYYSLFGALEKRLNLALRGRPTEVEEPAVPAVPGPAEAAGQPADQQQQPPQPPQAQDDGAFGTIQRFMRNGLLNTLLRPEENLLIENAGAAAGFGVGAGGGGAGGGGAGGAGGGGGVGELAIQLEINIAEEVVVADGEPAAGDGGDDDDDDDNDSDAEGGLEDAADDNDAAADAPPDIRRRRRQRRNDNQRPAPDAVAGNGIANGNGPGPGPENVLAGAEASLLVSDIVAAMAAQLLLPNIASMMGRVLALTLPRAWVRAPPPAQAAPLRWGSRASTPPPPARGLLQERWGRSLVGGCLYVVLRDGWNLYTKYRRVQVKRQRRIKNVDRKRRGAGGIEGEGS